MYLNWISLYTNVLNIAQSEYMYDVRVQLLCPAQLYTRRWNIVYLPIMMTNAYNEISESITEWSVVSVWQSAFKSKTH